MEKIRENMSKEDVVHNMLEIAFYLAQWDKNAHEIDVKVKNLNMRFEAWMDDSELEWWRMKENVCITCEYYEKCNKPEREIKCMGYKEKEKENE